MEPDLYTSPYIFASDINNDGYRELIFDRNKRENEKAGNYFVVYDVKNNKVLLDEANTKERSHYNYRFNYGLIEDKLTFYPYIGNYSESTNTGYLSIQFSSVAQSCLTLCNPMDCSTLGLPVHYQLPESTQNHVH